MKQKPESVAGGFLARETVDIYLHHEQPLCAFTSKGIRLYGPVDSSDKVAALALAIVKQLHGCGQLRIFGIEDTLLKDEVLYLALEQLAESIPF